MNIASIRQPLRALGAAAIAVAVAPALAAAPEKSTAGQSASSPLTIEAGELAADPDRYLGKHVTVSAEVEAAYGSRIFTLDEDRIGAAPDVLVLVPDHASVREGGKVTVSGVVREFAWTDLRRDYAWFDLRPQLEVVFRSRPVVVATSVKGADEAELVGRAQQPTLDEIRRQPGDYYGDFVSVRAPVGEIESPHAFTLDRGAGRPELLVLIPAPTAGQTLSEKTQVTVKGVVRPFFVPDLERDYDWFGLSRDLVLKLEDQPVIVAESVRNAAGQEFVGDAETKTPAAEREGEGEPTARR